MVYYLIVLLGGPVVLKVAGHRVGGSTLVGAGSVAAGGVLLLPAISASVLTISMAVLLVGIGHAAVRGPQIALALDIADTEYSGSSGPILAAMRSVERVGSIVGLLAVSMLAAIFDLPVAIGVIGVLCALSGLTYLAVGRAGQVKESVDV